MAKKSTPIAAQFMTLPKLGGKETKTTEEIPAEKVETPKKKEETVPAPVKEVQKPAVEPEVTYIRSSKKPGPVKYELIPGEKEIRTQIGIPESLNEVIKEEAFRRRITVKQLIGDILMKEFEDKLNK